MDELIKAAVPALLNDEQAKKALLDYIKALTEKVRPQEEWRQVWWRLSEDVRRYNGKDPITAIENPRCCLFVEVQYSFRGIGLIIAKSVHEHFAPNEYWNQGIADVITYRFTEPLHKESFDAKNYVAAIEQAQAAWNNVHEKWVAQTLPLGDE